MTLKSNQAPHMSEKMDSILLQLNELNKAVGRVEGTVIEMKRDLLGNGQPGRVAKLEARTRELEEHKQHLIGWIAGVSATATLFGGAVMYALSWLRNLSK